MEMVVEVGLQQALVHKDITVALVLSHILLLVVVVQVVSVDYRV